MLFHNLSYKIKLRKIIYKPNLEEILVIVGEEKFIQSCQIVITFLIFFMNILKKILFEIQIVKLDLNEILLILAISSC